MTAFLRVKVGALLLNPYRRETTLREHLALKSPKVGLKPFPFPTFFLLDLFKTASTY